MTQRTCQAPRPPEAREWPKLTDVSTKNGPFMLTEPANMALDDRTPNRRCHNSLQVQAVTACRYTSSIMRRGTARAGQDGTVDRASGPAVATAGGRAFAAEGTPLLRTGARGRAASSAFQVDRASGVWGTPSPGRRGSAPPPALGPQRRSLSQISQGAEAGRSPGATLTRTVA